MNSSETGKNSVLNGLWLLVVKPEDAQTKIEDQVPVMARAGNDLEYLLGFKNAANARKFLKESQIEDAEPRMVVDANQKSYLQCARSNGAAGILVDYDLNSKEYAEACELE